MVKLERKERKKENNMKKVSSICLLVGLMLLSIYFINASRDNSIAYASEISTQEEVVKDNTIPAKAIGAAIAIGLAAGAGAIGMGLAIAKSSTAIARQPEAEGKIRTTLMLGLVFIETAIIYALIIGILIIFVL